MRRGLLVSALLCLVFPAGAAAATGGAPAPSPAGGVAAGQATQPVPVGPLTIGAFRVAPGKLQPGDPAPRLAYRVDGPAGSVRVRVVLLGAGKVVRRLRLGWKAVGRTHTRRWKLGSLPVGAYVARLHAVGVDGRKLTRTAQASGRSHVEVVERPVVVRDGVFPVRGAYDLGGEGARFGAERSGHIHQGQDIAAAEGTPLVSPKAGSVYWRRYQADGAGHYLVVRGDDGRDYVFMHLKAGSILVDEGDRVRAGQPIAQVGNTGRSFGAHLHFEIWPGGWYAKGSAPIDPLPDLLVWAG